ncbi:MAG: hypothetical protein ACREOO_13350 [bacterium]
MKILHWVSQKANALIAKLRDLRHRLSLPVRIALATIFFILGVLGLFLPVLQGGLFLFISVWLLFPDESERWWERMKERFARIRKRYSRQNSEEGKSSSL